MCPGCAFYSYAGAGAALLGCWREWSIFSLFPWRLRRQSPGNCRPLVIIGCRGVIGQAWNSLLWQSNAQGAKKSYRGAEDTGQLESAAYRA